MKKNKLTDDPLFCRRNKVGGQAVLEGVMMKSGDRYSVASRLEDGSIAIENRKFVSVRKKYKFLNIPILRGFINFIEMMILSYRTMSISADAMGIDDIEPESKFEKWLTKTFGKNLTGVIMGFATVLGFVLAFGLFFYLPDITSKGLTSLTGGGNTIKTVISGVIKIVIMISYMLLVSLMPDIRRTFEYHGAEHKSIFCYESGEELTPENAKKCSRFHPRCGTSFLFVMIIISILIYLLPFFNATWAGSLIVRMAVKIIMLPIIVGIGFEFIMFAGKHDNFIIRALSTPGLWMQRITTREPDLEQLAVAIAALKSAMPDEFPDYKPEGASKDDGENAEAAEDNSTEGGENAEAAEDNSAGDGENAENVINEADET